MPESFHYHTIAVWQSQQEKKKKLENLLQIPVLQRIVATVEDFPQRGSKAPFITLRSQAVWGV